MGAQRELSEWLKNPSAEERARELERVQAKMHSPPYLMHKFWARRPWTVFRRIIGDFTRPRSIILDPFAGGGVTLVEGLILRRKVVAVDLNPLATFIMRHEVAPLDIPKFKKAVERIKASLEPVMNELYRVKCPKCDSNAVAEWTEYNGEHPVLIKLRCGCGFHGTKVPENSDMSLIPTEAYKEIYKEIPIVRIPEGEKTRDLLKRGYKYFHELFSARNLAALALLRKEILAEGDTTVRSFLRFTLSSTLKWASKLSHRRGEIVEGWAMHAFWVYPRWLEINVWRQFLRRVDAVIRGKTYTNKYIGNYAVEARDFKELERGDATYMIIEGDARKIPLPDESIDAVITDPPYGGNVNYAELSDYFLWFDGKLAPKSEEIIINRARGLSLSEYERGLSEVFRECHRVLKDESPLISTFNSKDMRIVAAFIAALRQAGFKYVATSCQPYLKVYETTFHALQVDAMPFDFVFIFRKSNKKCAKQQESNLSEILHELREKLEECKKEKATEREFRERTYPYLIDYIVNFSVEDARILAEEYEYMIKRERKHFSKIRKEVVKRRMSKNEQAIPTGFDGKGS